MTAKSGAARWSDLIISLHWAGAAIILALIALGWAMVYGDLDAGSTFDLFQLHKSLGFIALALTVARLAARFAGASPRAPDSPSWERRTAALAQGSLYVLTICAIVSGWLVVSASPLPVPTRFFNLFHSERRPARAIAFRRCRACAQARRAGNGAPDRAPRHGRTQAPFCRP